MNIWYVTGFSGEGVLIEDDERVVAVVKDGDAVELIRSAPETAAERDRLKEINREMLESLKYARRFLKSGEHDIDFVDAAIAKAEGGSK